MSVEVDFDARARASAALCDACGRTAPRAEMIVDADPDTASGWLCAEGYGCLVRGVPALHVAGMAVSSEALAAAPSETSAALSTRFDAELDADLFAEGRLDVRSLSAREAVEVDALLKGRAVRELSRLARVIRKAPAQTFRRFDPAPAASAVRALADFRRTRRGKP